MNKLIIIVGPTASKKSHLAFNLAKELNLEIINCDAFQIYKEISVGINKPTEIELQTIKHHFINNKSIFDEYNIKVFQNEFYELIKNNPNKNFILCGGSNLYIDSIIKNYNLMSIDKSIDLEKYSNEELWNMLNELDEHEAKKININNTKRLKQAIRIIKSTNVLKSVKDQNNNPCLFDYKIISTNLDRDYIYENINKRVIEMVNLGWKQEVENLLKKHKNDFIKTNALKAIGYSCVYDAIINNSEIDINKIQQNTRRYAKRQITWIKNKFNVDKYYDVNTNNFLEILNYCKEYLNEK